MRLSFFASLVLTGSFGGGLFSSYVLGQTSVAAQSTKTLRAERIELINRRGSVLAVLEIGYAAAAPEGSPLMTLSDESMGVARKVSLTCARLMMMAGEESAILAPDAGLVLKPSAGGIILGRSPTIGDAPGLVVFTPQGVAKLMGTGISFADRTGKPVAALP